MKNEAVTLLVLQLEKIKEQELGLTDQIRSAILAAFPLAYQPGALESNDLTSILAMYESLYSIEVCKNPELIRHEASVRAFYQKVQSLPLKERSSSQYADLLADVESFLNQKIVFRSAQFAKNIVTSINMKLEELGTRLKRCLKLHVTFREHTGYFQGTGPVTLKVQKLENELHERIAKQRVTINEYKIISRDSITFGKGDYQAKVSKLLDVYNKLDKLDDIEERLKEMILIDENGAGPAYKMNIEDYVVFAR